MEIEYGYCKCGCGQKTSIAKITSSRRNQKKGQPVDYVHNHHGKGKVKQFCSNGHERTPENVDVTGHCIACKLKYNEIYHKQYYENNSEKLKEQRLVNVEDRRIYDKNYAANNPDKIRTKSSNQRARTFNAFVSAVNHSEIFKRDNYICKICNEPLDMNVEWPDPLYPSIDHIIPFTKGGLHEPNNVQTAHLGCNQRKLNKIL